MIDLVKTYNPANAQHLTTEEINALQKLTSAEIKQLATAYPNRAMEKAYLLIIDSAIPIHKQLPSLSTFENLWNLREKNALKTYVAYGFLGSVKQKSVVPGPVIRNRPNNVVDLSDTELMSLPGFKTLNELIPPREVQVKKVKKQKVQ